MTSAGARGAHRVELHRELAVELHHLDVPDDELWRRIQARNANRPGGLRR